MLGASDMRRGGLVDEVPRYAAGRPNPLVSALHHKGAPTADRVTQRGKIVNFATSEFARRRPLAQVQPPS
jgi:hypothetical protein